MKLLFALLLSQAIAVTPPPQTATIAPEHHLHITETMQPPDVLIPGPPGPPLHPNPPQHLLPTRWFDGHARAALIVSTPTGYRVTVLTANGQHVTKDYVEESVTIDASMKQ